MCYSFSGCSIDFSSLSPLFSIDGMEEAEAPMERPSSPPSNQTTNTYNVLISALATACELAGPDSLDTDGKHEMAAKRKMAGGSSTTTRQSKRYRRALQNIIKSTSRHQQEKFDEVNRIYRVAMSRPTIEGGHVTEEEGVDGLFRGALYMDKTPGQVPRDANRESTPMPPRSQTKFLPDTDTESMLAAINEVDILHPTSSISSPEVSSLSSSAVATNGGSAHSSSRSMELSPRFECSWLQNLEAPSVNEEVLTPTLDNVEHCTALTSALSKISLTESAQRTSGTTMSSNRSFAIRLPRRNSSSSFRANENIRHSRAEVPMPRRSSSSSVRAMQRSVSSKPTFSSTKAPTLKRRDSATGNFSESSTRITKSISALGIRRRLSSTNLKGMQNAEWGGKSPDDTKKTQSSLPRSTSSKSSLRRRSSRTSFSSLRRRQVGIADSTGPGPNAVW